jgi:hypothetical protein
MIRYLMLLAAVVFAAIALTGCNAIPGHPPEKPTVAKCVTLEITLTEEVESKEGGGALESKELMKVVQRISIGSEFESRSEKKKDYKEIESGVEVDVTGKEVFSISGDSKYLDEYRFLLNMDLQYADEEMKVNFSATPSTILAYATTDSVVITESGPFKITLRLSQLGASVYTR